MDWTQVIIAVVSGFFGLLGIAITAFTPYLIAKVKDERLQNALSAVLVEVKGAVGGLQQTVVEDMRAKSEDGKLSKEDIASLTSMVVDKVKMNAPDRVLNVINKSKMDLTSYIVEHINEFVVALK